MGHTQLLIQWALGALSLGVKRLGRDADQSPPASAEDKADGDILPLPHTSSRRGETLLQSVEEGVLSCPTARNVIAGPYADSSDALMGHHHDHQIPQQARKWSHTWLHIS
jgi:hypothetical protein